MFTSILHIKNILPGPGWHSIHINFHYKIENILIDYLQNTLSTIDRHAVSCSSSTIGHYWNYIGITYSVLGISIRH